MKDQREIYQLRCAVPLLRAFLRVLPFRQVARLERSRIGGHIFHRHVELTDEVVLALRRSPASFPEAQGEADLIEADAQKGQLWQGLGGILRVATDAVMEQAVLCQGRSVERSRRVLQGVIAGAQRPDLCPHLPHRQRVEIMEAALRIAHEAFAARTRKRLVTDGKSSRRKAPRRDPAARSALLAGILERMVR